MVWHCLQVPGGALTQEIAERRGFFVQSAKHEGTLQLRQMRAQQPPVPAPVAAMSRD